MVNGKIVFNVPECLTIERAKEIVKMAANAVNFRISQKNSCTVFIDADKLGLKGEDEMSFFCDSVCKFRNAISLYDNCKED